MKNSKFVFDKITKLFEQGLISSRDLTNELITILKSKRFSLIFVNSSKNKKRKRKTPSFKHIS
jgi:hypothetical protein